MPRIANMGSVVRDVSRGEQPNHGNLAILTRIDKLRELVGTGVSLPQLVVVGDQSSGKSSVLEGLTGFAFPRDAELCTRYATQITCRRESEESINVSIIPSPDASSDERERVGNFHHAMKEMTPQSLAKLFTEANEAMGIRSTVKSSAKNSDRSAFSEHMLKIEKLGPTEDHFTVIDVPGIFRKETEGVTTEADIELVRNMVIKYMKDSRTIILAIMPSNVDPATQEILKLARNADPKMARTMAVLTKPDLAIEKTIQNIAISLVGGTRSDLTLGYYIVKNRGPDDVGKTLEEGQADEKKFFSKAPWSELRSTGKVGIPALKARVRELLIDLIKREFPKLRAEVAKKLSSSSAELSSMGQSRADQHTQRTYLNRLSESFQALARDALNAYYSGHPVFEDGDDLRLITRIVEANDWYAEQMRTTGHTRAFAKSTGSETGQSQAETPSAGVPLFQDIFQETHYPELEELFNAYALDVAEPNTDGEVDIMKYIDQVYRRSRGQELGTFGATVIPTMFKEQSKKWKSLTMKHMIAVVIRVHHFISGAVKTVCPDDGRVYHELWNEYLLDELLKSYRRAMDHAKFLLEIEQEEAPITLNHYFNDTLQKDQSSRFVEVVKALCVTKQTPILDGYNQPTGATKPELVFDEALMKNVSLNMANSEYVREFIHDVLKSYYKVSRKRFVDVVCQQAVNHYLLAGRGSPLKIFNTQMVLDLNEDQLDMIAGEDSHVRLRREKLGNDMKNFREALKVLRGSD
ncbi:P-loop containing nucleoside triphosphate hydrolase protein [Durotheca rogersii]|uniref:P-loop containing nucleoside triphosphate hydrolase protein n=1 Tax=Durotheca rogersii TaxID=419775 RepID=UPI0022211206|nr:P-loop containing nucleoside triphosphate hydrolase protein [Durotheca rogersii]KAI5868571.1 P-loop containing nucleoside triphosphate hydrolase protein [Durotheca rogersii]